jgi:hypothetical protein
MQRRLLNHNRPAAGLVRIGPELSPLRARYPRLVVELRLEDP